ncbi:amidohydrolase family protein [Negadavirga shengliensis]|uniref:Amidohydrolase family protein n=1 Tax=Negadavirga shengliensis TaxID=1389218 RepID=A0ABV9T6G2_9BACT
MNHSPLLLLLFLSVFCCKERESSTDVYSAFTGGTIVDGSGGVPIENGVLLIKEGRVVAIGEMGEVDVPENAFVKDVTGKTIIPGLINAHGHVGDVKGIEGGHYSRDNVIENLSIYARYGVTTVVSLGGDKEEAVSLRHVNDNFPQQRARLYIAGEVVTGQTPEEAVSMVDQNHKMGVDFMKIRVDDNLGTSTKMTEEVYRAVINRSHGLGYKIPTHMYYLEDAKKLLDAGSDLLAHSVRNQEVDDSFIELIKEKQIGYCPTLTRELSTYVYGDTASFFSDPFFLREYDQETIAPLLDPSRQEKTRNSQSAQTYQAQLPVAYANLKILNDAGVPIVFGTDSGVPTRFMGYFEHLEMEMMAEAGLTPMEIIVSATKNAAEYLELEKLGVLAPGFWADFIVLNADPLMDIRNLRELDGIYIGGVEVEQRVSSPAK